MATLPTWMVFIIDGHADIRDTIDIWLTAGGCRVVAFDDPAVFLAALPGLSAGCVLLDKQIPSIDGLSVPERARPHLTGHPVVMMAVHGKVTKAACAKKLGAMGFIEKLFRRSQLLEIRHQAFTELDAKSSTTAAPPHATELIASLSVGKRDALQGPDRWFTSKEMASRLNLSPRTVEMHRANIMKRLSVRSLFEALRIERVAGLGSHDHS